MFKRLSLTSRLTFLFTIITAIVVLGLGGMFVVAAEHHFIELDGSSLQNKQHFIDDILKSANSVEDVRWRLSEALNHDHDLFVRVITTEDTVIYQTDGFPQENRLRTTEQETLAQTLMWWRHDQWLFRVHQFRTHTQYAPATPLRITLAMDMSHHQHFLDKLLQTLIFYALTAIGVSGVLGWLAVYYGLAPLRAIKASASSVTAQRLYPCMPVDSVPIEMADLAQALNQMLVRLQQDFKRLSDFSSDLAHELRTPISNLLTQTQVTLSAPRENAAYREILASNAEELQRLARMVSDMLLLAKTERGVDLPQKEIFLVADEVKALLDFYDALAEDNGIVMTLHGDGSIVGDRLMFRRALSNLLSNALRHTPANGCVHIIVSGTLSKTEISVENTGEDIDPRVLPRLFDRFYRADSARAHPTSDGAGLGLAITKAIVDAHDGHVSVTSSLGFTRFTIVFPSVSAAGDK